MNTLYKLNALIPLFLAGLPVLLPDESIAQVYPRQSDIRPNTIDERLAGGLLRDRQRGGRV